MKKWIAMMLIAVMALALVACGSKDEPVSDPKTAIIGTWQLKDVEGEGEEVEYMKQLISMADMTYTFKEDGTVTVKATIMGQEQEESTTWSLDGDNLTVAGDTGKIEITSSTLKMHLDGYTVVYKKK
jgi:hypothetical protein